MGRGAGRRRRGDQNRRQAQRIKKQKRPQTGVSAWWYAGVAALLVLIAAGVTFAASRDVAGPPPTPTPPITTATIDGIPCESAEQLAYHIHQYVELYDHGTRVQLPSEIGIESVPPGDEIHARCIYYLHVHSKYPNIIHVESPTTRLYTLGNFMDIWTATQAYALPPGDSFVRKLDAAQRNRTLHAYFDLKPWTRPYRSIPLTDHGVITLEIGRPLVPPAPHTRWNGL